MLHQWRFCGSKQVMAKVAFSAMPTIPTKRTRGARWTTIRRAILRRDGFRCVECRKSGKLTLADQVDHIIPLERGGTDDTSNLQSLCHAHHVDKTNTERGSVVRVATGVDGWPLT